MTMGWESLTTLLLAVVAFEAAIIGYMLRHYFLRIENMIRDFEHRIERLEKRAGFYLAGCE